MERESKVHVYQSKKDATNEEREHLPAEDVPPKPRFHRRRRVKRQIKEDVVSLSQVNIPGVEKIVLEFATQKALKLIVGDDVTSENPWKYITKEALEDNLDFYQLSSDFLSVKDDILKYPRKELLLGYVPNETAEIDEFYICLTVKAEEFINTFIDRTQKQREDRLNNSIFKIVKRWRSFGSDAEVDLLTLKNTRPLFEIELESPYPVKMHVGKFKLRMVDQARDGYKELLSTRTVFNNLIRKKINTAVQVTPYVTPNEAQTICTYPKNASSQYEFNFAPLKKLSKTFNQNLQEFVDERLGGIEDKIYVNSYINFYNNDYEKLIKDKQFSHHSQLDFMKEFFTFYDQNMGTGKVITSLSWHPMLTGTITIAYSEQTLGTYRKSKPNDDIVVKAMYELLPVLLWSFLDRLTAKLFLETPREVTCISFCPFNENLLVGGCANGQIILWDITDRLKKVEAVEILTVEQQSYRAKMKSLMKWMRNTKDLKVVRSTAVSDLEYSHSDTITSIVWLTPFGEHTRAGKLHEIAEDQERLSMQFLTASLDGTILIWDLLGKPVAGSSNYKPPKKSRRLKEKPQALTTDTSHFKIFNRILKPIFVINLFYPNTTIFIPLTRIVQKPLNITYVEKYPNLTNKRRVTDRVQNVPVYERPDSPLLTNFIVSSATGNIIMGSWDGFDFNTGEIVNKEAAKMESFVTIHDGPVSALIVSQHFRDLLLTVGGTVFAIWLLCAPEKPVFWRRCTARYTHGVWNTYRPELFRVTRGDGYIELWNLSVRSDRYQNLQSVSGGCLTGTFSHPFGLKHNVMGVGDYNGAFRLYSIAHSLTHATDTKRSSTYLLIKRELDRKLQFQKWQELWRSKNPEIVEIRKQQIIESRKKAERHLIKPKEPEPEKEQVVEEVQRKSEIVDYGEMAERRWQQSEADRMNAVLLSKKSLDRDVLEKQQQPLIRIAEEKAVKANKLEQRLSISSKLYDDAVNMLFPEAVEKKPPPTPDPYGGGDCIDIKVIHYEDYKNIEEKYEKIVDEAKFVYRFNWLNITNSGVERRKLIDGWYYRYNHTSRPIRERMQLEADEEAAAEAARLERLKPPPKQRGSSLLLEQGILPGTVVEEQKEQEENKT